MLRRAFAMVSMSCVLAACGGDKDDAEAPELPPADSMELPALPGGNAGALVAGGGANSNVNTARLWLGGVTAAIAAHLVFPQAVLADALRSEPERDGDEWVWSKTYPVLGYETELRGSVDDGVLHLELRATGLRDNTSAYDNFLWFTGDHEAQEGNWTFYALDADGPRLSIDWQRDSASDKSVAFTNVAAGTPQQGDSVTYSLDGTSASMAVHDARDDNGSPQDFTLSWDVEDGSGIFTHTGQGLTCCWDDLDAGQVNIDCP